MKQFENYDRIVAIKERSGGNETIGDMWFETKSFSKYSMISEVVEWAKDCSGKLIIAIDENGADDKFKIKVVGDSASEDVTL